MNTNALTYEGGAFNPTLGNELIAGRIFCSVYNFRFESEAGTVEIAYNELTLRLGEGEDERLFFTSAGQPDWTITTSDYGILKNPGFSRNSHVRQQIEDIFGRRASRKALTITLSALFCFMLIAYIASWGVEQMVRQSVKQISPAAEKKFGDELCARVKAEMPMTDDEQLTSALTNIYSQLRLGLPNTNMEVEFHIVDSPIPNAGSIPGHIFVNKGLFDMLDTPEQMAGVLAHELGHITQRHVYRKMISSRAPAYLLRKMFGHSSGTLGTVARSSQFVLGQSFSKEYEREADEEGWKYLVAAKINPHGFIEAMAKFKHFEERNIRLGIILSDHPATEERIQRLEAHWAKLGPMTDFVDLSATEKQP